MANVILVYPVTGLDVRGVTVWLPLSVLTVASTLTGDYEVVIVDQRTDPDWRESISRHLTRDTLCVGISSMTGTQIRYGLKAAEWTRRIAPDLPIVWGGNHPTLLPEQTARHPLVDIVVMGEGEATFRSLVNAFKAGRDWKTTANIAFKKGEGVAVQGSGYDFVDPGAMPELPYELIDVENYVSGNLLFGHKVRSLPFITSSGCPYACTFCCQPVLSNRRWRRMDPDMVVERTFALKERYDLDAIEFHDEEFFVDRLRGARIAERIGGAFDWYAQTRMDDLLEVDLAKLERCGMRSLQLGLESGSNRVLDLVKKQETVEQYRAANTALARTGIQATYNFMMGFPTETEEELKATVRLVLELTASNPNAYVAGFYVFVPYPGSALYDLALANGFRPPESLSGWSQFNRHNIAAPWIEDKTHMEFLMVTSKLIDGRRLRGGLGVPWPAKEVLGLLSRRYRSRWEAHALAMTWDAKLLSMFTRRFLSGESFLSSTRP